MFPANSPRLIGIGDAKVPEAAIPLKDSVLGKIGEMIAKTMNHNIFAEKLENFIRIFNPHQIVSGLESALSSGLTNNMVIADPSRESVSNNTLNNDYSINIKIDSFHGGATKQDGENFGKYIKDYMKRSGR